MSKGGKMTSLKERLAQMEVSEEAYLELDKFTVNDLNDGIKLNDEENIKPALVASAAKALARILNGTPNVKAFELSLKVAEALGQKQVAEQLLLSITSSNDPSVINATKLVSYEMALKSKAKDYQTIDQIDPDKDTIFNIRTMVTRGLLFLDQFGPMVKEAFGFGGAYTDEVTRDEADFLSQDSLWNFSYSTEEPSQEEILLLFSCYQLGKHTGQDEFKEIKKLGIFNPRFNKTYQINLADIPARTMLAIEKDVLGYEEVLTKVEANHLPEEYIHPEEAVTLEERLKAWESKNKSGLGKWGKILAAATLFLLLFLVGGYTYLNQKQPAKAKLASQLAAHKSSKIKDKQSGSASSSGSSSDKEDDQNDDKDQDKADSKSSDSTKGEDDDKSSKSKSDDGKKSSGKKSSGSRAGSSSKSGRSSGSKSKGASSSKGSSGQAPSSDKGSSEDKSSESSSSQAQPESPATPTPEAPSPAPAPETPAEPGGDTANSNDVGAGDAGAPATDNPSE